MTDIQTPTFTPQGTAKLTFLCHDEIMPWLERWAQVRSQTVPEVTCDLVSAAVGFKRDVNAPVANPRQSPIGAIREARSRLDAFPDADTPTQPKTAMQKKTHPGYTWLAFHCPRAVYESLELRCQRHEKRGDTRSVAEVIVTFLAAMLAVKLETNAPEIVVTNTALDDAGETPEGVLDAYRAKKAMTNGKDG